MFLFIVPIMKTIYNDKKSSSKQFIGGDYRWLILVITAIILAGLNLIWHFRNKKAKWFRYLSFCMTALTVCAFYSDAVNRVESQSWSTLMDIMSTMNKVLWV